MANLNYDLRPDSAGKSLTSGYLRSIAVGAIAALAFDRSLNHYGNNRHSDIAAIMPGGTEKDRVIYTLPGCRTDGHIVADMLRPQLETIGDATFVAYPKRSFNLDSVKDEILKDRQRNLDRPASFYAVSMGGLVLNKLLSDKQFMQEFGMIDTLVFDSSPSHMHDIRPSTLLALGYAGAFHDSWAMGHVANVYMTHRSIKNIHHDEYVSDELVKRHLVSSAHASLNMTEGQRKFIKSSPLNETPHEFTANSAYYLQSPYDSVVDTVKASERYALTYPGMQIVTDSRRPYGSHAAGPEYQRSLLQLLNPIDLQLSQ